MTLLFLCHAGSAEIGESVLHRHCAQVSQYNLINSTQGIPCTMGKTSNCYHSIAGPLRMESISRNIAGSVAGGTSDL